MIPTYWISEVYYTLWYDTQLPRQGFVRLEIYRVFWVIGVSGEN